MFRGIIVHQMRQAVLPAWCAWHGRWHYSPSHVSNNLTRN